MATRFAIASGNWSNPAIWDSGALPVPGDDVYANGYTIAVDQNITVSSLRNGTTPSYYVNNAIPVMTSATQPSGQVTSTSVLAGYSAYQVFDRTETGCIFNTYNAATIRYQFPTAKTIIRYAFCIGTPLGGSEPATWTFDGSNDGTTWTNLHSVTVDPNLNRFTWYSYSFTNTNSYLYYRLAVTATHSYNTYPEFMEIQMTEDSVAPTGGNKGGGFTLAGAYTINANIIGQANGTVLSYTALSPTVATVNGYVNLNSSYLSNNVYTISHTGTGTLNINGNIYNTTLNNVAGTHYGIYCGVSNGVLNINGNVICNRYSNYIPQLLSINSNFVVTIVGDVTAETFFGNYTGGVAIWLWQPCTLNIIGDLYSATQNWTSTSNQTSCINCSAAATVNITGNVYCPSGSGGSPSVGLYTAITISAAANFTITGNIIGGASMGQGIYATSAPTINITGNIIGCGYQVVYLNGNGGSLSCTGVITASGANAVFVTSAAITSNLSGPFINTASGVMAVNAPVVRLTGSPTRWYLTNSAGGDRTLYSADFAPGYPNVQDVRSGVSYNAGLMTGTMVVPAASTVASGVPVDATTGTAFITSAQVGQAVWDYLIANIADPNSIGFRLKDASTVTTTGSQIQALNGL